MPLPTTVTLGAFLRDRRARLDPLALGFPAGRRRTPGLRREEVAARANISPTWYTWLEQDRGGAPSADVLERIAAGLLLTEAEREHLFLLALRRPPEIRYRCENSVTPRLQRVVDAFELSPAMIRTATWDVVAWNRAAAALFVDYSELPPKDRNILRLIFSDPRARAAQPDWRDVARLVIGAFRMDAARVGASEQISQLVEELSQAHPEFEALWRDSEFSPHAEGVKRLRHPKLGLLCLEISSFAVVGRPELQMIVYNPATSADADAIRSLLLTRPARATPA